MTDAAVPEENAGRIPAWKGVWVQVLCLAALVMVGVHLKVRHSTGIPRFDSADETGYFKVESAFQYRYAAMAARGEPFPELDRDAQHPEGVRVSREHTTLMESAAGWTWRLWPLALAQDFRLFIILWVAVVSSLSVPAFYLAGLRLSKDAPLAMLLTWAYGLSWAGLSDQIGSFTFQCLAMPLILWSFACFCLSIDPEARRHRLYGALAGVFMGLALASWHVTRFYLAGFLAAAAWTAVVWRGHPDARRRLGEGLGFLVAGCVLAGLAFPVLRETRFLVSPTMILGYGLLGMLWRGPRAAAAALAAAGLVFLAVQQSPVEGSSFGHTYSLLFDKLRFLLVKPADPALLGPETRYLWVGPFNSPEAGLLIFTFLPVALVMAPRLVSSLRRRWSLAGPPSPGWTLADAMLVLSVLGAAMMTRLIPFVAFFGCLAAGRLKLPARTQSAPAPDPIRERPRTRTRTFVLACLVLVAAFEGLKSAAPYSRLNLFMMVSAPFVSETARPTVSLLDERRVLTWLRTHAGPGKPVLAYLGISGPILAYTRSPVVLNPKGESALNRRKTLDFLDALYADEAAFHRYCSANEAAFFVYGTGFILDETPDGARYASGSMVLRSDAAAVRFHFEPEALEHFRLVYQNPGFRVFAVGGIADPALPGDPVYDMDRFAPERRADGTLGLDVAGVLSRMRTHRMELLKARIFARMGWTEASLEAYGRALAAWPSSGSISVEIERLKGGTVPIDAVGAGPPQAP